MKTKQELWSNAMRIIRDNTDFNEGVKKAHCYLLDNSAEYRDICSKPIDDKLRIEIERLSNMLIND